MLLAEHRFGQVSHSTSLRFPLAGGGRRRGKGCSAIMSGKRQPDQPDQPDQPSANAPGGDAPPQPWEQMAGEPDLWYGRFQAYLGLGPARTVVQAMQSIPLKPHRGQRRYNGEWARQAATWLWRERAMAWDDHQHEALNAYDLQRGLRRRRIALIGETLDSVRTMLAAANLDEADQETAREWLPQTRILLRDMLAAERREFERPLLPEAPDLALTITADDLRAAQRALEAQQAREAQAQASAAIKRPRRNSDCTFLVCTGADPNLLLDLAVLRGVREATGLRFRRLINPTAAKLSKALARQRSFGRPIEHLHLAVHSSAGGLLLQDGPVDGDWLSERLEGVRVLLLASCASDGIGDRLSVVPYVVSLSEEITHEDAAVLARHFLQGIGLGQEPGAALDYALERCMPAVGEFVVRHW